jgi:hypothetical protein
MPSRVRRRAEGGRVRNGPAPPSRVLCCSVRTGGRAPRGGRGSLSAVGGRVDAYDGFTSSDPDACHRRRSTSSRTRASAAITCVQPRAWHGEARGQGGKGASQQTNTLHTQQTNKQTNTTQPNKQTNRQTTGKPVRPSASLSCRAVRPPFARSTARHTVARFAAIEYAVYSSAELSASQSVSQRQGKAKQSKARQGKARQGKARQGKARQGKAKQSKAKRVSAGRTGRKARGRPNGKWESV